MWFGPGMQILTSPCELEVSRVCIGKFAQEPGIPSRLQKNELSMSGIMSASTTLRNVKGSINATNAVREKIVNSSSKVPQRIEESNRRAV